MSEPSAYHRSIKDSTNLKKKKNSSDIVPWIRWHSSFNDKINLQSYYRAYFKCHFIPHSLWFIPSISVKLVITYRFSNVYLQFLCLTQSSDAYCKFPFGHAQLDISRAPQTRHSDHYSQSPPQVLFLLLGITPFSKQET